MALSDDEKKFAWFWVVVFSSAIGFWTMIVHWAWRLLVT
jgi:hypothetical protein